MEPRRQNFDWTVGSALRHDGVDKRRETIAWPVGEKPLQAAHHHRKGQLVPGNVGFFEQHGLKAFGAGCKLTIKQFGAEDHINLVDVGNVIDRVQFTDLNFGAGFLQGLAHGRLLYRLAVFHEAGGNCPQAVTRLDGPAAQQDTPLPLGNTAGNDIGVLVMDSVALAAHVPRQGVARGNPKDDWRGTLAAIFHGTIRPALPE